MMGAPPEEPCGEREQREVEGLDWSLEHTLEISRSSASSAQHRAHFLCDAYAEPES